ncbi:MAG: FHA domain-containing protein [bacterium]
MMIDCPKCKVEIEQDSCYCDQCGQELKICPQCTTFGKGNRCTKCGTVLISVKQKAVEVTPVPSPAVSPAPSPKGEVNVEGTIRRPSEPVKTTGLTLVSKSSGIRLAAQHGAIIGRKNGPYTSLLASQGYISGTHARFDLNPQGFWTITDLGSTNGTFVNNQKIDPNVPQALYMGTKVTIADLEFFVDA